MEREHREPRSDRGERAGSAMRMRKPLFVIFPSDVCATLIKSPGKCLSGQLSGLCAACYLGAMWASRPTYLSFACAAGISTGRPAPPRKARSAASKAARCSRRPSSANPERVFSAPLFHGLSGRGSGWASGLWAFRAAVSRSALSSPTETGLSWASSSAPD